MDLIQVFLRLIVSSLKEVEKKYFLLPTTYSALGVVRERVFCYELYHKMRCNMYETLGITLNGELTKQSQPEIELRDRKVPDFLFHSPGTMQGNLIICEVKGKLFEINGQKADLEKDFKTLEIFISKYQYKAGVFVLYNHDCEDFFNSYSNEIWLQSPGKCDKSIYIIFAPRQGYVSQIMTLEVFKNKSSFRKPAL